MLPKIHFKFDTDNISRHLPECSSSSASVGFSAAIIPRRARPALSVFNLVCKVAHGTCNGGSATVRAIVKIYIEDRRDTPCVRAPYTEARNNAVNSSPSRRLSECLPPWGDINVPLFHERADVAKKYAKSTRTPRM